MWMAHNVDKYDRESGKATFKRFSRGSNAVQHGEFLTSPMTLDSDDPEVMKLFLERRMRVQESFIRETEKTRRTALWLSAGLIALASLVPVFAPAGRETISYWVSIALFVFAAGAAGYSVVRIKGRLREITASNLPPSN
jgi:hypothetical protein